jgi:hypothetical protein
MKVFVTCFAIAVCFSSGISFAACDRSKTASTSSARFTLNETMAFDQKTKLTWSRCSVGTVWKNGKCSGAAKLMSLGEVKEYAKKLGGGWRVPTIEELFSIVEQKCSGPAINSEVFPSVKDLGEGSAPYWSTTKIKEIPSLIYYIDFISGEADGHTKGFAMAARLVRGGK